MDSEPGQRSMNRLRPSAIHGHHLRDGLSGAVDALRTRRNPRSSRTARPRCRKGCAVNQSSCRPLYPDEAELDLRTKNAGRKGKPGLRTSRERKDLRRSRDWPWPHGAGTTSALHARCEERTPVKKAR
ncbi:hypothetical protein BDW60DRAFT_193752 [Aspergillus nidulans var. acristatus]